MGRLLDAKDISEQERCHWISESFEVDAATLAQSLVMGGGALSTAR